MEKITNIAKNTSYFTSALVLQKIITFSYFVILARYLGPADLGKYYFAISFTSIFSIFIDLGLSNVLTREIARYSHNSEDDKLKLQNLIGGTFSIKIIMAIFSSIAVIALINILHYPDLTKKLVYIALISMNLDSFTTSFYSIMRGFHNLLFESIGSILFQIVVFALGLIFIQLKFGLIWIIFALSAASVVNFIYSFLFVNFKYKIKTIPSWNLSKIKSITYLTTPFAFYAVLQRAYMYFDTVLLSLLAGDVFVGLYQVPFKIVFALQFLPMAFTASLYPAMSSYWLKNKEQLAISFERAMNYLIIISVPISAGIITLSDVIIMIFKEGYLEAILPMQIIIFSLIFVFVNFPIGSLLNAAEKQRINTINMLIVTIASIALNLILIPKFRTIGASITVLATNLLMFILGMYWVPKIIEFSFKKVAFTFLKSFTAALAMSVIIICTKNYFNIVILVVFSSIIYFTTLFLLKGFRREDIRSIYKSFKKI